MKKGGGKRKGGQFERDVCRTLSLWWSDGVSDAIFYRTGGSGGRGTKRGRAGKATPNHCGDVGASDPVGGPLLKLAAIELKNGYNDQTLQDVLDSTKDKGEWREWIAQAEESAKHAGAYGWMIVVRRDKRRTVLAMSADVFFGFHNACQRSPDTLYPSLVLSREGVRQVLVVRFEDFLKAYTPDDVRLAVAHCDYVKGNKT